MRQIKLIHWNFSQLKMKCSCIVFESGHQVWIQWVFIWFFVLLLHCYQKIEKKNKNLREKHTFLPFIESCRSLIFNSKLNFVYFHLDSISNNNRKHRISLDCIVFTIRTLDVYINRVDDQNVKTTIVSKIVGFFPHTRKIQPFAFH